MNLITYYGAYSLYPRATFDEKRSLICCTRSIDHEIAITKYIDRGWEMQNDITEAEQEDINASFRVEDRWIGDVKTWFLPFPAAKRVQEAISQTSPFDGIDLITLNSISLAKDPARTVCEMKFTVLRPCFYRNKYTASFNLSRKLYLAFKIISECDFLHRFSDW